MAFCRVMHVMTYKGKGSDFVAECQMADQDEDLVG